MNRHEVRKEVFKAVFMNEFHDTEEMDKVISTFLQGRDGAEAEDLAKNNKTEDEFKKEKEATGNSKFDALKDLEFDD